MIKWIGQHIWDFISRFRNDVYLEAVATGTIASGGNLGVDDTGKIVKNTVSSGTVTWNKNDSFISNSDDDTEFKYVLNSGNSLNGTTTDPTSITAENIGGCFWIAPAAGAITKIDIQGETNHDDTLQFRFYKAGASANASNITLTHMFTTSTITTYTNKSFNAQFDISSGGTFSARDRIWFFLQKQTDDHTQTTIFNLHVTGTHS